MDGEHLRQLVVARGSSRDSLGCQPAERWPEPRPLPSSSQRSPGSTCLQPLTASSSSSTRAPLAHGAAGPEQGPTVPHCPRATGPGQGRGVATPAVARAGPLSGLWLACLLPSGEGLGLGGGAVGLVGERPAQGQVPLGGTGWPSWSSMRLWESPACDASGPPWPKPQDWLFHAVPCTPWAPAVPRGLLLGTRKPPAPTTNVKWVDA